jgi:hypothetical protein
MDPPSRASGRPTVVSAINRVTMRRYARQLRAYLASRGPLLRIAQSASPASAAGAVAFRGQGQRTAPGSCGRERADELLL